MQHTKSTERTRAKEINKSKLTRKCCDMNNEESIPSVKKRQDKRVMSNTDGQPPLCTGDPQAQQQPPHTTTGTVQWLTLPPLTSSVSAQAIWPKNSWCAKKVKTDAFFQLQQKQLNHPNKTKVEACNIQPGFSQSNSDCVLAINSNLFHEMLCANFRRWMFLPVW